MKLDKKTKANNNPHVPKLICRKCGHTWTSRIKEPLCCPKCKQYNWQKPRFDGVKQ